MPRLVNALRDWDSDFFARTLKSEIENLPAGTMPLDQGTSQGGFVDDENIAVTVLRAKDGEDSVQADVGVFFTEVVAGCSCGDEPMAQHAYCEIRVRIDKATAETEFSVIPD